MELEAARFRGFGGGDLHAGVAGSADDPTVLLLHAPGVDLTGWQALAEALARAGRRGVALGWREGEAAPHAEDLRAVLAQLGTRPVIVAAGAAAAIAVAALDRDAAMLTGGLVLLEPLAIQDEKELSGLGLPLLWIGSGAPVGCEAADLDPAEDRDDALFGLLLDFLERRQPRGGVLFRSGSDSRTLREALGCFATGITIVTAIDDRGNPTGLTANSFTSVSLDPPLLLVCIANSAGSAMVLREARHFAVNVLQIGQQPASNRFAGKGEDRFGMTEWTPGETGAPLLDRSLCSFECRRNALHESGDHFILVGEVVRAQFEPQRDPLLYFRGKYRRLHFA